jgi:hypothetical protein
MTDFSLRVASDSSIEKLQTQLGAMPADIARAKKRALKKLSTWLNRQALKEASEASGVPQKNLQSLLRYRTSVGDNHLNIWIGTIPIKAHHLGVVRWSPQMPGAQVGTRSFPHSFAWQNARRGAGVVFERVGTNRLPLKAVTVDIHEPIITRLRGLMPEINDRYLTLMRQELNYALNVESQ